MTDIQPDSSHTPAAAHSYLHMAHRIGNRPYIKFLATHAAQAAGPDATQPAPWNVADLCRAYDWPSAAPGGGKIAIVELGGGWLQSDVDRFFQGAGLPA